MTDGDPGAPPPRRATFRQTLAAVFWSFFGIRKGRDMQRDSGSMNAVHVIVAGVAMAVLLVLTLAFIVHVIVK